MLEEILLSTLRLGIPLAFAALGGLLSERAGVANIALEATLLFSAFAAAAMTTLSESLMMGLTSGVIAGLIVGLLFSSICIWGRGDQIVVGAAFNLFAVGLLPLMMKALFQVSGSTPALPLELRFSSITLFVILCGVLVLGVWYLFRETFVGLRIHAAGENPQTLANQGVSYRMVRLGAVTLGSALVGLGGVYLSLCQGSGFIRNMSAGRGFIALAALILGGWKPFPTLAACFFFAFTDAIQIRLQGTTVGGWNVPNQLVQISPFIITFVGLALFGGRMRAPLAINRSDEQMRTN
ncbi:MAG: ABC transporter permease [Bdellovibrionales bacterium]